ncbi:hypothetical protein HYQ46_012036 [Verticillium longisporum]|nr:hypothetical protein HYQ46_012036 [Verticillium longisporum]
MGDEEHAVRPGTHGAQGRRVEEIETSEGHNAGEDDGRKETSLQDADLSKVVEVAGGMENEQGRDDSCEDSVPAVEGLVRRVEDPGQGAEGLEDEQILERHEGRCNGAQAFGEVEVVWLPVSWGIPSRKGACMCA